MRDLDAELGERCELVDELADAGAAAAEVEAVGSGLLDRVEVGAEPLAVLAF